MFRLIFRLCVSGGGMWEEEKVSTEVRVSQTRIFRSINFNCGLNGRGKEKTFAVCFALLQTKTSELNSPRAFAIIFTTLNTAKANSFSTIRWSVRSGRRGVAEQLLNCSFYSRHPLPPSTSLSAFRPRSLFGWEVYGRRKGFSAYSSIIDGAKCSSEARKQQREQEKKWKQRRSNDFKGMWAVKIADKFSFMARVCVLVLWNFSIFSTFAPFRSHSTINSVILCCLSFN